MMVKRTRRKSYSDVLKKLEDVLKRYGYEIRAYKRFEDVDILIVKLPSGAEVKIHLNDHIEKISFYKILKVILSKEDFYREMYRLWKETRPKDFQSVLTDEDWKE